MPQKLPDLTPRERAVLDLLVAGSGKAQIAAKLQVGERTVDRLLASLIEKFGEIDPKLDEAEGTVGKIARLVALYVGRTLAEPERGSGPANSGNPLLRLSVRAEIEIGPERTRNETEISVECLHEKVELTSHGVMIDDLSPNASALPDRLEVGSNSQRVKVGHRMVIEDPKRPLFQVLFDPPLTLGQQLTYFYYLEHPTYFAMSQAELARRVAEGVYPPGIDFCEKSYSVNSPTRQLYLRLSFPPGFGIVDELVAVNIGRGGPTDHEEEKRIWESEAFSKRTFAGRTSLILSLDNPRLLRRYRLCWRPAG